MARLSQNKKIAVSVVIVFILSFTAMVLFLDGESQKVAGQSQANIFDFSHSEEHGDEDPYIVDIQENYLELSPVPMMMVDGESRVSYVNKAFCILLTRIGCEEMMHRLVFDLVNVKDMPGMFSITNQLFRDGETIEGAGPYRFRDGNNEIMVMVSGRSVWDAEGKVSHILLSFRDITSQVKEMTAPESEPREPKLKGGKPIKVSPDEHIERMVADRIGYNVED